MSQTGANTKQREPITSWFNQVIDAQGLSVVEDAINRSLEPLVGPDDELVRRVVKKIHDCVHPNTRQPRRGTKSNRTDAVGDR